MQKTMKIIALPLMLATSTLAGAFGCSDPYQQTQIAIKNDTTHVVTVTITDVDGTWKNSAPLNVPMLLQPKQIYQNTSFGIIKNDPTENFASIAVAQIDNTRDTYPTLAAPTIGAQLVAPARSAHCPMAALAD